MEAPRADSTENRVKPAADPVPTPAPSGLDAPVQFLRGVGPARARLLAKMGVATCRDLLHLVPRRHEDRRTLVPIASLRPEENATVRGVVREVSFQRMRGRLSLVRVVVGDDSGTVVAEWWNQPFRRGQFKEGEDVVLSGKVRERKGLRMSSPETETLSPGGAAEGEEEPAAGPSLDWGRIVPVYPLTRGLRQPVLRRAVRAALDRHLDEVEDPLPEALRRAEGLPPLRQALAAIHFPAGMEEAEAARRRMRFDELLLLQLALALRRRSLVREERGFAYALGARLDARIRRRFPFRFTAAQDRAVADVAADLAAPHPMNRLLQGDVGCGKTAVALYLMLVAVANRRQAAILAPTEVLADQHHANFLRYLQGSRVRIELLAGGLPARRRAALRRALAAGEIDVAVGTHALLEGEVRFRDLGVAVVDEQHRFGVLQRKAFRDKGLRPDLLYLTATPIPRTLALTLFGDLDVSVITERPPGRRPVTTRWVRRKDEAAAHRTVREEVGRGRQAFFICPLVEESEELDLRAATEEAERLRAEVYPDLRVGLLHGRLPREEKRRAMEEFRAGRTHVLVSTVVIEVGVDVPNASVLVVLHAERFGLSQLHQLRGRIGRGPHASTCFLFSESRGEEARARLKAMVETEDGFAIAEKDLEIRGPGDILGTRQHGLPDLRMPEALADTRLLERARKVAFDLVARDPGLSSPEGRRLQALLRQRYGERSTLAKV